MVQTIHGFGYKFARLLNSIPVSPRARPRRAAAGLPLTALERTAWRRGLRAARSIERRASAAFAAATARVLRTEDLIAHDRGSDAFLAALIAPTRDGHRWPAPVDIRSALARTICGNDRGTTELDVDAGWTRYEVRSGAGAVSAIGPALARGAQERERYAFFSALGHELRTAAGVDSGLSGNAAVR